MAYSPRERQIKLYAVPAFEGCAENQCAPQIFSQARTRARTYARKHAKAKHMTDAVVTSVRNIQRHGQFWRVLFVHTSTIGRVQSHVRTLQYM
eukprot:5295124-Pleurochrysis_carterae.AAC.7